MFVEMIDETDKSQDVLSEQWVGSQRADGVIQVQQPACSRPRKSWCVGLGQRKEKDNIGVQNMVRHQEFSFTQGRPAFFFCPVILLIGWQYHHIRVVRFVFTQWTEVNIYANQKYLHSITWNNIQSNTWAPQASGWHKKLWMSLNSNISV